MIDVAQLYDEEILEIERITSLIMHKYQFQPFTIATLEEMQKDVIDQFEKLGIRANLDYVRCLNGEPPMIILEDLIEEREFDHDKKTWEVKRSRALGGN